MKLLTVDGLVNTITLALAVRNAAQASTGQQANAAGDNTSLVADDVAKEIASDDNTVKTSGVLDENHGSAIDELVLDLEIRELAFKRLRHDLAPQTAGGQHIRLVQGPNLLLASATGHEASQTSNTFDLGAGVGFRVPGRAGAVVFLALAKVDAARQLADNDNVGATADLRLEGRGVNEGVRGKEAWAQVTVCSHLFAQLQKALFRSDGASAPFRAANGTEKNGIGGVCGSEGFICEGASGSVNGALLFKKVSERYAGRMKRDVRHQAAGLGG